MSKYKNFFFHCLFLQSIIIFSLIINVWHFFIIWYNNYRKWRPQTWIAYYIMKNTSSNSAKFYRCVFLLFYFCLLIITAITIIKANVMIVIPTKEQNNMYIILINVSIIRLTSFMEANHICLFSFPMLYTIQHFISKNKRTF